MRRIRTYRDVADPAAEDIVAQVVEHGERLTRRLASIRKVIVVASGKGGVGKSALTANLATALADRGLTVGAADADLNGPSLARMLGASDATLQVDGDGVQPAEGTAGVRVMSMDLLLADEQAPLRWGSHASPPAHEFLLQSTLETGALREFLADVAWGDADALVIDAPPGTDKLLRLVQLLPRIDVLLLVTTPSEISRFVVARSVRLAASAGEVVRTVGLVANMTDPICETCGSVVRMFGDDGARALADASGIELWAEVPFDPRLAAATDAGRPFVLEAPDTPAARAIRALADRIAAAEDDASRPRPAPDGRSSP
jgi:ATP-binding protein involved in chromosome partitioning